MYGEKPTVTPPIQFQKRASERPLLIRPARVHHPARRRTGASPRVPGVEHLREDHRPHADAVLTSPEQISGKREFRSFMNCVPAREKVVQMLQDDNCYIY